MMDRRTFERESYLFGFQGMERDADQPETQYHTLFRQYDAALGRWWSNVPLQSMYPSYSPYTAMAANPVNFIDPLGLAQTDPNEHLPPGEEEGEMRTHEGSNFRWNGEKWQNSTGEVVVEGEKETDSGLSDALDDAFDAVWNSDFVRNYIMQDFVSVGLSADAIIGVGMGYSFGFTWVTRGKDASWLPIVTASARMGAGFNLDITGDIGKANYLGDPSRITRKMVETSITNGDVTYFAFFGVTEGAEIGMTVNYTPSTQVLGTELNVGLGVPFLFVPEFPFNASAGVSNTWILYDFK